MFGSSSTSTKSSNEYKSKRYFKDNKLTGLFQDFDPYTGKLKQQGRFENGIQVGKWRVIDDDGDQIYYSFTMQRVGAICGDGSRSSATGRGACSWHGGVAEWLYDSVRHQTGGTGKYMPIEQRVQNLKKEIKKKFKITQQGLEFQQAIYNMLLDLADEKEDLLTRVQEMEEALLSETQAKAQIQSQLEALKQTHSQFLLKEKQKDDKQKQIAKINQQSKDKEPQKYNQKQKAGEDKEKELPNSQVQKFINNDSIKQKEKESKQDNKPNQNVALFEKVKGKQESKPTQKKKTKMEKKKKVESDNSDDWLSEDQSEDEREKGQKALITQLLEKMNIK